MFQILVNLVNPALNYDPVKHVDLTFHPTPNYVATIIWVGTHIMTNDQLPDGI